MSHSLLVMSHESYDDLNQICCHVYHMILYILFWMVLNQKMKMTMLTQMPLLQVYFLL